MIEINGQEELERKLERMLNELDGEVYKAMYRSVAFVREQMPGYPAKPEGSTYRRRMSGGLGGHMTGEVRGVGVETVGVIGNNMVYAPWVISDEAVGSLGPQAKVHEGRWYVLQDVVKGSMDGVVNIFRDMLRRWMR